MLQSRFWILYVALVLLRLFIALQPSYLHPDEFFQTSEIAVSDALGWPSIRTWEFDLPQPIRSIIPIHLFQSPVLSHLYFFGAESPTVVFYASRIQQWAWSLVLDAVIYATTSSQLNILLFASSYSTLVFQTHTLSNAWESILVLVSLYATMTTGRSLMLGILAGLGLLTRPTYLFFLVPFAISRIMSSFYRDTETKRWVPDEMQLNLNSFLILTFIGTLVLGAYIDTIYHAQHWMVLYTWYRAIFAPINNIFYNSVHSNLATHGIHPRYQHLLNLVIMLGPGLLLADRIKWKSEFALSMTSGFLFLSLIPHQELRFLCPVVCLFFISLKFPKFRRPSRLFWVGWATFNILAVIAYGVLHQCGVIPAALWISKEMPTTTVTFNDCYPSPQFLVGPDATVRHIYGPIDLDSVDTEVLVTPTLSFHEAQKRTADLAGDWEEVKVMPWHIDLDRVGDFGQRVLTEAGLGIYRRRNNVLPAAN